MLRGAAYEEGRIHQKELDPKDCAMKITNIIQADDGNWNCNVTSKLSNGEYDIGKLVNIFNTKCATWLLLLHNWKKNITF